jgi:Undecaprenyl-phosphate glucose phosphotransferase
MAAPVLAGLMRRRVALVGSTGMIEDVRRLLARSGEEVELVAAVPVCGEEDFEGKLVRLREATVDAGIDEVVLCLPLADAGRVRRAVDLLLAVPAEVSLFADRAGIELAEHGLATAGRFPRMRLLERPVRDWGRIAKGLMDRVGAAVLLVLLSPLFAVIALAIRLDSPGPVFYRQLRRGLGGRPFEMLKFRSMYADRCDAPDAPIRQARRDDPRFTRVGRFLRRTSLDELPQLWNVLRGEMSLVGPRPHAVRMDEEYRGIVERYMARYRLKPGITGWAQVHGYRGETRDIEAMRARIAYDVDYARSWSLALDLWILFLTPWIVLSRRNAY